MRILYFAAVAEKVGETQENISLPPEVRDVRGLLTWLRGRGADWEKALAEGRVIGFVIGEDAEMAERRFYAAFAERTPERAADKTPVEPVYATPVRRGPPSSSDVIGLFPEPGAKR